MKKLNKKRFGGSLAVAVAFLCGLLYWQQTASMKSNRNAAVEEQSATVHVKGLKSPHINFKDGVELSGPSTEGSAPAIALAAADFDSDGVPDLVTADRNGLVRFRRGNPDTIYPNSPEAKAHFASNGGELSPFQPASNRTSLPFAPDFFVAGDFNADGQSDILAAAKGADSLYLLGGNGRGDFAGGREIQLGGQITAFAAGEIGRRDGQTDVAVAIKTDEGAELLVFENPESAFKQKPEVIKLSGVVNEIAIGDLDDDFYADVVLGSGSNLTIVHGRGQAYPFDRLKGRGIKRPAAVVETRVMPFDIAALAIGRFTERRGNSLAILSTSGSVQTIETVKAKTTRAQLARVNAVRKEAKPVGFRPAGIDGQDFALLKEDLPKAESAAKEGSEMPKQPESQAEREKLFREQNEKLAAEFSKLGKEEVARRKAEARQTADAHRATSKEGFITSISAKLQSPLANWNLQTLSTDSRLASAASGNARMLRVRVSDSNRDDLVLLDATSHQIQIVSQSAVNSKGSEPKAEVFSLEADSAPLAVLPMRLNPDALSDLVVLREGSAVPAVVMTTAVATYFVTTAADSGGTICDGTDACSLRQAITLANQSPGSDDIFFDIPDGGVQTIHPLTPLPDITDAVTIDAGTQPGYGGSPLIEIRGDQLNDQAEGLRVNGSNCVIRGFSITEMPSVNDGNSQIGGSGIILLSTSLHPNNGNNIVEGNFLGLDYSGGTNGTGRHGNDATGLSIFDSDNNTVGGSQLQARNLMSHNGNPQEQKRGVGLAITGANSNIVEGNFIGTDTSGLASLGNSTGVFLAGKNNLFGGINNNEGNTVSGNGEAGIPGHCGGGGIEEGILASVEDGELLTYLNDYIGNNIGTTGSGAAFLGNCTTGVKINTIAQPSFGSITQRGRNVVSGNGYDAIWANDSLGHEIYPPGVASIVGNNIGTDRAGNVSIPNNQRNNLCLANCSQQSSVVWANTSFGGYIVVGSPAGTTSDGACTGFCNLISGNNSDDALVTGGILRDGAFGSALIVNNYIGTNISGVAALPNFDGIVAHFADTQIGGPVDDGNGGFVSGGNLISGNGSHGIVLQGGSLDFFPFAPQLRVEGNLIGTSADGLNALPNDTEPDNDKSGNAIGAFSNPYGETLIGGPDPLQRNVIAGNAANGIRAGFFGYPIIRNNFIGLNAAGIPLANGRSGIIASASDATIGGFGPNEGNFIVGNVGAGVLIESFQGANTSGNQILGNAIFKNGGLGIDLTNNYNDITGATDGVTANDCFDLDTGANGLQNYPELNAPTFNANGTVTLTGTLRSEPVSTYTIQFYESTFGDPSDYGEGVQFLGHKSVETDGNGFVSFTFTSTANVDPSHNLTATATSSQGSTSEFSCIAGHCVPAVPSCSQGIVVNVTTDDSDANVNDAVCDTDLSTPGSQCSLRAAIQEANVRIGKNTISFAIPGSGVQTILPLTPLPAITHQVLINGASQPGYAGSPLIEIRGDQSSATDGLVINSSPSEIRALAISRFPQAGIKIQATTPAAGGSTVSSCYLGINADGASADTTHPLKYGVSVVNSTKNVIGGRNVIGNFTDAGVFLSGSGVQQNKVQVNRIGMSAVDSQPLGTGTYGVLITGSAKSNTIGGDLLDGNLISGSLLVGIGLDGNASLNIIRGNRIGTDQDGNHSSFTQGDTGILIKGGALANTIGGGEGEGNVIAGNDRSETSSGIHIDATADTTNKIIGNYIGINQEGNAQAENSIGVLVERSGVTIGGDVAKPNVISGNTNYGIQVQGETAVLSDITISNNFIGTDSTGLINALVGNGVGVLIAEQVQGAKIKNNTISGNSTGLDISLGATATVTGNLIGTGMTGQTAIQNEIGIAVVQTADCSIKDNIVSGNHIGILLGDGIGQDPTQQASHSKALQKFYARHSRPDSGAIFTERITIQHNQIGTNLTGALAIGNTFAGIAIGENARNNTIGGSISKAKGNTISGSIGSSADEGFGIYIGTRTAQPVAEALPNNNIVQGNRIGLKVAQDQFLPNKVGIYLSKAENNYIGGGMPTSLDKPDTANIIGGNSEDGVRLLGPLTQNNVVVNNFVGVTQSGTDIGNQQNGVAIIDAPNNRVGVILNNNNQAGSSNVIAANHVNGILVQGGQASGNNIFGNTIGIFRSSPTETVAIGNGEHGIKLLNVGNTSIGGTSAERRNFIGGNGQAGIFITGSDSTFNSVKHNFIGTDQNHTPGLGNGRDGVWINDQAAHNTIGGPEANADNIITGNAGAGVRIDEDAGCCNLVDPNSIYGNADLGIDIGPEGNTDNDQDDSDSGANNLQNFPEMTHANIDSAGNLSIVYKVDSQPGNSNYGTEGLYVEFFEADAGLEGQTFIAGDHYTIANYNDTSLGGGPPGLKQIYVGNAAALSVQVGDKIVATATDADGNTSEFTSTNVGTVAGAPTAATAVIDGQILTSAGVPAAGVTINLSGTESRKTITDSNGHYQFTAVETSGFYTVTPSRANFSFTPANRSFSALGNRTEAAFTAIPDTAPILNPLDTAEFFVRQHYLDFLGREPDEPGFNFWSDQILGCRNDAGCTERKRVNVSAAYFLSIEFQQTGGLVDGLYRASYGRRPFYAEFVPDTGSIAENVVVGRSGWEQQLATNKRAFVEAWLQRPSFTAAYDSLTNARYVDELIAHTGVDYGQSERDALLTGLTNGTLTRAAVLQRLVEDQRFVSSKFNQTFVMMEYFGYLRRDPDESGYQFWLMKLNQFHGNFEQAEMVKAFIDSGEYRARFGR